MRVPFVAHSSLDYWRWAMRSVPRRDGRRFTRAVAPPVQVPVLQLHGALDPFILTPTAEASTPRAGGRLTWQLVAGAGHFLPDEAPAEVGAALLDWLATL